MGFKVNKKELNIKFSNEEYDGLEVVTRYPSIRESTQFQKLTKADLNQEKNLNKVFEYLSEFIIRWNLEDDDGNALPVNAATFLDIPMELTNAISTGFVEGAFGVTVPLESVSPNGEISQELHVPMEAL